MDYLIQAFENEMEILGSQNSTLVQSCKNSVKVKNALKRFKPQKNCTSIKVFSYSNLYDKNSYKLIKTIKNE